MSDLATGQSREWAATCIRLAWTQAAEFLLLHRNMPGAGGLRSGLSSVEGSMGSVFCSSHELETRWLQ